MRPGIVLIVASLTLVLSFWPGAAQAKGGFVLFIEPEEVEWGQSVRLEGSDWPEGVVQISARFYNERFRPDGADIASEFSGDVAPGDFSFERVIAFDEITSLPQQPTPGWIEITVLVGVNEMHRSLVVTADGRRPPGAAYISGLVHNMSPASSLFVIWSPVDDPSAYAFKGVAGSGGYRIDYLSEGEWFVGLYDLNGQRHAAGRDLIAITAYSKELGKNITFTGRVVTARPGEAIEDSDFTLVEGPAPAAQATKIASPRALTTATPAPTWAPPAQEMSSSSSDGWLAPALLGVGSGLLLAVVGTMRLAGRRRG